VIKKLISIMYSVLGVKGGKSIKLGLGGKASYKRKKKKKKKIKK